jgi:surface polysaccharide O-acyltransferase-like enzyme
LTVFVQSRQGPKKDNVFLMGVLVMPGHLDRKRILYFDILRIIAIFAVIFQHVAATEWFNINAAHWNILNFYHILPGFAVPVFIMVSGALHLSASDRGIKYFLNRALKVLFILFFWIIVYKTVFLIHDFVKYRKINFDLVKSVPHDLLMFPGGTYSHLWFLNMIIGLYLLSPVIRVFVLHAGRRHIKYFLLLFLFAFTVRFYNMVNAFINMDRKIFFLPQSIYFPVNELLGYAGYYIAGYYFVVYEIGRRTKIVLYISGILSLAINTVGTSVISTISAGANSAFFDGYITPTVAFFSFSVFLAIKEAQRKYSFAGHRPPEDPLPGPPISETCRRGIVFIGRHVFSIFLIHNMVIAVMRKLFGISVFTVHPAISVPLITLAVFIISLLCGMVMAKMPFVKRMVQI